MDTTRTAVGLGWLGSHLATPVLAVALFATSAFADVLDVMRGELERSHRVLSDEPTPIYYLSYEITEDKTATVSGTFGALTGWSENESRGLDVDLRVGSPDFDNTRELRSQRGAFPNFRTIVQVPLEDEALRTILWYQTDRKYKEALERFTMVQSDEQVSVEADDESGDFSVEKAEQASEETAVIEVDRDAWEDKVRRFSAPFAQSPHVFTANATIWADAETRWYVNTEGSAIKTSTAYYRISISASIRADDGMVLPRTEQFFSLTPEGLPDDETVMATVNKMVSDLEALREAPLVEPYTGPAMLSGRASGVFFHEILGHRLEGHRQKGASEGQTFRKMVGEAVLPETFSVVFDPTIKRLGDTDLVGAYRYDNQGVKARRVPVIEDGVLTNFLMGRIPIEGFPKSNGHGRKNTGFAPVARQSNLIVEVSETKTRDELKAQLLAMAEKEGKPFGLLFDRIQGGFTITGRSLPNAFNVTPTVVYRINLDGSEELVRGVDLIGTPLTAFSRIVAAGDDLEVFNGTCGAESGPVPVSAASPSILVSQIEVQKKDKSQTRLPILMPPGDQSSAFGAMLPGPVGARR
ncbi:MAG: metallopeptidase TldD-related protein [Gammaproteobacteria bacterium]|nr:metallopeptidase TldD-related protein [Gammaproteobacteria bacterium]